MHPREFFAKAIKTNVEVSSGSKTYKVDTLNINDFYFKCKIANIRKTLDQNQSLNKELCLDNERFPLVFNLKQFIRALEDIAEIEQSKLYELEKSGAKEVQAQKPASPGSSPLQEKIVELNPQSRKEKRGKKPMPASKQPLTTIDEILNETVTTNQQDNSHIDEDSKIRSSKLMDFEDSIQNNEQFGVGLSKQEGQSRDEEPMGQSWHEMQDEYPSYDDGFDDN